MMQTIPNLIINDTSWSKIYKILITLIIGLIFMNIFFPFLFRSDIKDEDDLRLYIQMMIFSNFLFLFLFIFSYVPITPIQKTTIFISEKEFKIILQEKLYIQIKLSEIVKLKLIKVGWGLSQLGYTVNFESSNYKKKIRKGLFVFAHKKQELVVNHLKQVSKKLNIPYIELKERDDNYDERAKDKKFINNFIKNF